MNPMAMPMTIAASALSSRLRSSRMWSMSGIRPWGLACRCDAAMRAPSRRAPVMVSASFAMGVKGRSSAGLLRLRCLRRGGAVDGHRLARRRLLLLQVADLLLQLVDLLLLLLGCRQGRGRLGRLAGLRRVGIVIVVQVLHLGLEDAHLPAQRAGRVRHLLAAEEDDQHHRDDQYLPRAVEQVTQHVSPHPAGSASPRLGLLAPKSLHVTYGHDSSPAAAVSLFILPAARVP